MESNRPEPVDPGAPVDPVGAEQAAAALADIDRDQRAVRDTPWPVWLYPVNTVLLVALGLSFLLPEPAGMPVTLAVAGSVIAANLLAGRANGAPFALPTSRVFLGLVALSAVLLVAAMMAARDLASPLAATACSVAAGLVYAVACVVHHRSTRGAAA